MSPARNFVPYESKKGISSGVKDSILKDLNPQQHKAVTTLDGPILIVAGAGTGKTKVITHRIAHLIKTFPHLSPSNFLAVTFSKKAAEEMLTRVESLIGEHKDELWISTFHSFCHRILKDHALDIGLSRNFRLLDKVEQWIFFKNIMPQLNLKYYVNLADPFGPINDFIKFISRCKNELVSPQDYLKYADTTEDTEEKTRAKEVARMYAEYQRRMKEANCLDFGDLINLTIALFQKRKSVLSKYEDQFHYILVDEFQDTNIAQIELISILAKKRKNICVVGDDDQGIYRFRGASYASFIKFKEKFPNLEFLKLTQNYRSTKKILAISGSLIKHNNPDRFDPQKDLWTNNRKGVNVSLLSTDDYDGESYLIAEKIKEIHKKEKDYSKIAILYRAHSHNQEIIKRLKSENIPYNIIGPMGLFERDEIKDIVAIFSVLNDSANNVSLFRMLTIPRFKIDLHEVVELTRIASEEDKSLYDVIKNNRVKKLVDKKTEKALSDFKHLLKHLIFLSNKVDIEKLFYEIIEKTGYVKDLVIGLDKENETKLSNIGKFYNFINAYIQQHENIMLSDFVEYLKSYIEAGGDITEDSGIGKSREGVQLMTIHQAKGLEFPYVFIISLVQNRFPTRMRPEAISFPIDLIKEELPKGNFHLQEERRLFYVAITRTKEALFISTVNKPYHKESIFLREIYSKKSKENITKAHTEYGKEKIEHKVKRTLPKRDLIIVESKKSILNILEELEKIDIIKEDSIDKLFKDIKAEYYKAVDALRTMHRQRVEEKILLSETLISIPEDLKFSYTQLDTFIRCPLKYKFNYIYNIPPRPTAPLRFGTDMHDTLEDFYKRVKEGKAPTFEELYKIYLTHWNSMGYVNKSQETQYKKSGFEILKRFYETNKDNLFPPLYIEEEFLIKIGDCQFKGYIDRIDELPDGGVEIIDYKTGKPKDQRSVDKSIQLDLYAIASQEVLNLEPKVLSFYFLTSNEKISVVRNPEDLERTKEDVVSITEKIKSSRFEPTPGVWCKWCDYRIICPVAKL